MNENPRKVFISYSWAVQARVVELAERLIANGIDVILDVWDLKPGHDKYAFMEQSVNDPSVNKVLIICDKTYTAKADARQGGVGDETVIISPEIYGRMNQEKFIPIAFEVDDTGKAYIPHYLKSRIYFDLSTEDDRYEVEYEKLLRNIYDMPQFKKPALGKRPEWLEPDAVNLSPIRDVIKQIRGYTGGQPTKADYLLRHAADLFVETAKEFVLPDDKPEDEGLLLAIDQTKGYRDAFLDFCESIFYSNLPFAPTVCTLFERLYNALHTRRPDPQGGIISEELYDFMLWELFICTTALLLHLERYGELHDMLIHTYFLNRDSYNDYAEENHYFRFRKHSRMIEEQCKPKSAQPNLHTLQGNILVQRERKPVLTKESISNADLVLYQMGQPLGLEDNMWNYWFPTAYCYHKGEQEFWRRMKSEEHCRKIMPLFGVSTIEELKEKVKQSPLNGKMRYSGDYFERALGIRDSIKVEDIASLN